MIDLSMLQDFIPETVEHLEEMENNLLKLEEDATNIELLNEIFRSVHTIKGASEYIGLARIAELSHKLENLLELLRQQKTTPTRQLLDTLIASRDRIAVLVEDLDRTQTEDTEIGDLLKKIAVLAATGTETDEDTAPALPDEEPLQADLLLSEEDLDLTDSTTIDTGPDPLDMADHEGELESLELDEIDDELELPDLNEDARELELTGPADGDQPLDHPIELTDVDDDDQELSLADLDDDGELGLADSPAKEQTAEPQAQDEGGHELELGDLLDEDDTGPNEVHADDATNEDAPLVAEENAGDSQGLVILAEDYDRELFEIYIDQLKENHQELARLNEELKASEDKTALWDRCLELLQQLKSASNYMGYEKVVAVYEDWCADIFRVQKGDLETQAAAPEFMNDYMHRIQKTFPQIQPEDEPRQTTEADETGDAAEIEAYDEEHDEELFEIFLDQLRENFNLLKKISEDLVDENNKTPILDSCLGPLQKLKKSANYMGYEALADIYDRWEEDIEQAKTDEAGGGADIGTDFMLAYLREILQHFPQIVSAADSAFGPADTAVQTTAPARDDTVQDDAPAKEPEPPETAATAKQIPVETTADEAELFGELGQAFDAYHNGISVTAQDENGTKVDAQLFSAGQDGADTDIEDKEPDLPDIQSSDELGDMLFSSESDELAPALSAPAPEFQQTAGNQVAPVEPVEAEPEQEDAADGNGKKTAKFEALREKLAKQNIRVDASKIDALMNQVGELVVSRAWFSQLFNEMRDFQLHLKQYYNMDKKELKRARNLTFRLSEATVALGRVANDLQEGVMKIRMLPIAQLFSRYPRLVRDLVRDSGKKVRLDIKGEETELDKMIIEELSDPFIHIIRNAMDHGIETVGERERKGKPATGKITLEAYHESNHVVIEIADDGRGIDAERIKLAAIRKGFLNTESLDRMTPKELMGLIMQPGFSTAHEVTHTSGRGVGMDVVKKNIEKLNGTIEVDSKVNVGTRFRIKIPLTLAIIPALLVRVGTDLYTVPLSAVEETLRINNNATNIIEGFEVIHLRENTLPLVRLADIFKKQSSTKDPDRAFVVVVNTGLQAVGLVVDELIGQEEVVIKPLVDYLQEKSGFSGATILGDGRISLILDVYKLVNMSINRRVKQQAQSPFWTNMDNSMDMLRVLPGPQDTFH